VTTIAPTADYAAVSPPNARTFDRAAMLIFGAMVGLIVLLTVVLLEAPTSATATSTDEVANHPTTIVAQTAAKH
jgi:hypothetical protein